ncbi:uncharacterized protein [Anabrus simplex]|uniref:uncharacterized protein n=1 Tax=Anabrus simplex TaxID=316456 RepID=UPI0035A2FCF0
MGAAWCKNKAQAALDKVTQIYPSDATQKSSDKHKNGTVSRDTVDVVDSPEVTSPVIKTSGAWQEVTLEVPEQEPLSRAPVPPPRKKRQLHRKMGMSRPPPPEPPATSPDSLQVLQKPRPKNVSSVSLPNYSELTPNKSKQKKNFLSPGSARKTPSTSSISDATVERVEKYMRRCRSFGSMREQLAEKLSSLDASSDSDDSWAGLDDWDLGVIEHETHTNDSPILPTSKLNKRPERKSTTVPPTVTEPIKANQNPPSQTPQPITNIPSEDDWFGNNCWPGPLQNGVKSTDERDVDIHPEEKINGVKEDANIKDVKRELQSIIYDFNRAKKISTSSMEVLPTQPVRTVKKKISVASVTPPPSPELSDAENDSENAKVIASMVMNKTGEVDETTHSTLLRLLRECQNIEGALEQLGLQDLALEDSEIPGVHCSVRKTQGISGHRKLNTEERSSIANVCKSVDSGLDLHSTAEEKLESHKEDFQSKFSLSPSSDTLNGAKSIDSGLNDLEEHASPNKTSVQREFDSSTKSTTEDVKDPVAHTINTQNLALKDLEEHLARKTSEEAKTAPMNEETESLSSDFLRKPKTIDQSGGSSGRSSMTPSLSELEAALSDMLEKSTEEDDSSLPITCSNSTITSPSEVTSRPETSSFANGSAVKLTNQVH